MFAVIVFIVFTWTLYVMFWHIPSWLGDLNIWEVLVLIAYVLSYGLFESVVMLGLMVALSLIFPLKWFRELFVPQGTLLMITLAVGAYILQQNVTEIYELRLRQLVIYPMLFVATVILLIVLYSFLFRRFNRFTVLMISLADRLIAFLLIYVPISLVSLFVVILRNLL